MKNMRIGIDARLIYRTDLRGMGKYLFYTITHIKRLKPELQFILYYEEDKRINNTPNLEEFNSRHITIKGYRLNLWEQLRMPLAVHRDRPVFFHSPAEVMPVWQPVPFIVTLHDTVMWERDEGFPKEYLFYYRKVLPLAFRKARKILTVSHFMKKEIIRILRIPEEKIVVIYNGLDKVFRKVEDASKITSVKQKYGIRDKYLFALGAEGPRKNTALLIEAFAELKRNTSLDIQLVIAGIQERAMPRFREQIEKLGLTNYVIMLGFLSEFINEDLVCLYSGAEAFLYPSLHESFGIPNIEAMACGTPVITSNVKAIPEITDNAAFLINPYDKNDLVQKIILLLNNPQLKSEFIEKGLKRAQAFSWEKTAEQTLKVYEEMFC